MKTIRLWGVPAALVLGLILSLVVLKLSEEAVTWQLSFDDPNPAVRAAAIRKSSRGDNLPLLFKALEDSDPDVRLLAVLHFERLQSPSAANALIPLLKDSHAGIRKETVYVLGTLGPDAWPSLRNALRDDHPLIRLGAIRALNKAGTQKGEDYWPSKLTDEILPALKELTGDPDPEVRREAEGALEAASRRSTPRGS